MARRDEVTAKEKWRNRIVENGDVDPATLVPNPRNYRRHPERQVSALTGSLVEVGWVAPVTVNRTTGRLVDGHARVELALRNDVPSVPVQYVELSEAEEAIVLASLDPISAMASHDAKALDALLRDIQTGSEGLMAMFAEMAEAVITPSDAEWAKGFDGVPDTDRTPFQQMTFTLHDAQAETVRLALKAALQNADFTDGLNENSNGNGLWTICHAYLEAHDG